MPLKACAADLSARLVPHCVHYRVPRPHTPLPSPYRARARGAAPATDPRPRHRRRRQRHRRETRSISFGRRPRAQAPRQQPPAPSYWPPRPTVRPRAHHRAGSRAATAELNALRIQSSVACRLGSSLHAVRHQRPPAPAAGCVDSYTCEIPDPPRGSSCLRPAERLLPVLRAAPGRPRVESPEKRWAVCNSSAWRHRTACRAKRPDTVVARPPHIGPASRPPCVFERVVLCRGAF